MQTSRNTPGSLGIQVSHDATSSRVAQLEYWLPPMLSIVAGMVDLTGFYTLGNVFTAHVTAAVLPTRANRKTPPGS